MSPVIESHRRFCTTVKPASCSRGRNGEIANIPTVLPTALAASRSTQTAEVLGSTTLRSTRCRRDFHESTIIEFGVRTSKKRERAKTETFAPLAALDCFAK